MRKILLTLLAFFALLPGALFAYTSPGSPVGFVNDFAELILPAEQQALETKLVNFEKITGNEITVVTIATFGDDTIENYAVKLFEEWGIGKADKDNGILLLVSRDDREMRIEVGYGLEPELTDSEAGALIRNVLTPAFAKGDFYRGIDEATSLIIEKLQGQNSESFSAPSDDFPENFDFGTYAVIGFFAFTFLSRLFASTRSWWLGGLLGALAGLVITMIYGFISVGLIAFLVLTPLGFILDFIFSKIGPGRGGPGGFGGFHGGGGGSGGFGGFGGGSSGGGGASGKF